MASFPRLRTPRLRLDPVTEADADGMVSVLADAAMYEFTGGEPPTVKELGERYRRLESGRSPDGRERWCNWVVRIDGDRDPVGIVQATVFDDRQANVAWQVAVASQGAGIAPVAAGAVVEWLDSIGVEVVEAHVHPEHQASAGVAARIGLDPTDELVDGERVWRRSRPSSAAEDPPYVMRRMAAHEVQLAVDWAAAEGWNPGLNDAELFRAADPGGFLVGTIGGEPIATISVVRYGPTFAFLGFYIVAAEHRGHGYGLRLWAESLADIGDRVVGLDGVVAQQHNYAKSGFVLAYNNRRYEGRGGGSPSDATVPLHTVPWPDVVDHDAPLFPADREPFLRRWIGQPGATALGVVGNGALRGYGVMRPCRVGHKVGPLVADDPEVAETLLSTFRATVRTDEPVFLDVPEVNPAAVSMAEHHGMHVVFETARMYRGPEPDVPLDRWFGVTSFELG